jgi:hypothetical protein
MLLRMIVDLGATLATDAKICTATLVLSGKPGRLACVAATTAIVVMIETGSVPVTGSVMTTETETETKAK